MTKLLLVEDEAISRLGLTRLLIAEGYAVTSVASGEEALKQLDAESFDGVITDSKLGHGVSGIDILTRFERLNPGAAKLLITAYPLGYVGEQTVGALYVSKPIDLEELLLKLKRILPVNGY